MEQSRSSGGFFETVRRELRLRNYSHKTIKAYLSCLRSFVHYFHPRHPRELGDPDLREYLLYLIEKKQLSAGSVNQAHNALLFLYAGLYGRPMVIKDIPRAAKGRRLPVVLNFEEVLRILRAVENVKHRTLMILSYSSGLRVGELVSLRLQDIDVSRKLVFVRGGKGAKDRYTVLSDFAVDQVRQYCELYRPRDFLFEGAPGKKHLSERSAQAVFERAVRTAGVTKQASMHTLRHSFATHLLESGVGIRYIQEMLGHKSSKTTEIYTHVSNAALANVGSPLDRMLSLHQQRDTNQQRNNSLLPPPQPKQRNSELPPPEDES